MNIAVLELERTLDVNERDYTFRRVHLIPSGIRGYASGLRR